MPYHSFPLPGEFPLASRRVELCHDAAKTVVWLQLTNTEHMIGGTKPSFVTALIGATKTASGWAPISPAMAGRYGAVTIPFGDKIGERIGEFQLAILRSWRGFNSASAQRWAKGLTIGHDMSSPSFVMEALKTGFNAIGVSIPAYSGLRMKRFSVDDAIAYLQTRATAVAQTIADPALHKFDEIGPDPGGALTEDEELRTKEGDRRPLQVIPSVKSLSHGGRFAYAQETRDVPFERVIGYAFRGDSRPPSAIQDAGGLLPNYTRDAHTAEAEKKNLPQDKALSLAHYMGNQFHGGFISLSKSYAIAKAFAANLNETTGGARRGMPGWVYVCFVEGGFDIPLRPPSGRIGDFVMNYDEQEVAVPGMLDWDYVVACRRVDRNGTFEGNIFIKRALMKEDQDACGTIFALLSGTSQDTPAGF